MYKQLTMSEILYMFHSTGMTPERKAELDRGAPPTDQELAQAIACIAIDEERYEQITGRPLRETTRAQILRQASDLTHGDRNTTYGDFTENHERIAQLWSIILQHEIGADQVALCMAMVKMSRLIETPDHEDTYVDACAYIAGAGEIALKTD